MASIYVINSVKRFLSLACVCLLSVMMFSSCFENEDLTSLYEYHQAKLTNVGIKKDFYDDEAIMTMSFNHDHKVAGLTLYYAADDGTPFDTASAHVQNFVSHYEKIVVNHLKLGTTYHFQEKVTDLVGNVKWSDVQEYTTPGFKANMPKIYQLAVNDSVWVVADYSMGNYLASKYQVAVQVAESKQDLKQGNLFYEGDKHLSYGWNSVRIENLVLYHKYYVRTCIKADGYSYYSDIVEYMPRVPMLPIFAQNVTSTSVRFSLGIDDMSYGAYTRGIHLSTEPITDDITEIPADVYQHSATMYATDVNTEGNSSIMLFSSLMPNTTYYARSFMIVEGRLHWSNDCRSITTRQGFTEEVVDYHFDDFHDALRFIKVLPGTFTMGATPEQELYAYDNERPAHEVTIDKPFYIAETEVTTELGNRFTVHGGGMQRPYHFFTWYLDDVCPFLEWIREKSGLNGFRLPTEEEWEYAARGGHLAGEQTVYAGSNSLGAVTDLSDNAYTIDVKSFLPNALGVYDMSGGVWEWTSSLYDEEQTFHVLRGGAHGCPATDCRVSRRVPDNIYHWSSRLNYGIRLVYDPSLDEEECQPITH